ncbi:MAG: hypothetical protein Q9165_008215 [Trypethelium subeluteriae]
MSPNATLVPVFFSANIPNEVVDDFLSKAYSKAEQYGCQYKFRIVDNGNSAGSASQAPVADLQPRIFTEGGPRAMLDAVKSHSNVTDEVLVILDSRTEKGRATCRLVWRYYAHFTSTRSQFGPSLVALAALLDGKSTMQQLQNDAAAAGGALTEYTAASQRDPPKSSELLSLQQRSQEWNRYSNLRNTADETVILPVFCTAEISLEVINNFISSIYSSDVASTTEGPHLTLVSSQTIHPHVKPITSPLSSPPAFPFLGFPISALATFIRQNFPGNGLHHTHFIVLDAHTASAENASADIKGRSCIIGDLSGTNLESECAEGLKEQGKGDGWKKSEGGLALARVPLLYAFSTCMALDSGDLDVDLIADEAASRFDGVNWGLADE